MATATGTQVTTGEVRLSYVNLFNPRSSEDDRDPEYTTALLIPKSDKKTIKALQAAIEAAKEAGKSKWGGKIPKGLHITLRDGDEEKDLDESPEYEGHMFMNVKSKKRVPIVDRRKNPITDETEIYSGCYARVAVNAGAYNYQGNKGVSFYLNAVQKTRDGDPLGSVTDVDSVFEELDDEDFDDEDII